jgi:protein phosphatase
MMNGPINITAHFAQFAGVTILSSNGNGSLSVDNASPIPFNESGYVPDWHVNSTHTIQALSDEGCGFSLGPFHGCVYQFQEWLVNGATPVSGVSGDTYAFKVSGKTTRITAVYLKEYSNLEIAAVLTIVIVAAVLYLWPKKKPPSSQLTVTRGLSYQYGCLTDVGKIRSHNEDSVIAMEISATFSSKPTSALLCAVADGVGGARKGEVASTLAIQTVTAEVLRRVGSVADIGQALTSSIEAANEAVVNYGMEHRESEGLATTIVASILDSGTAYVAHVGDSRAYLLNSTGIRQLTKDHSQVQELIDANQLTLEQARQDPRRNVITRAVGGATDIQVSLTKNSFAPGDRILLCSDGLWGLVSDTEILQIVLQSNNPQSACNQLVYLANQREGRDNISVIIVEAKIPDTK